MSYRDEVDPRDSFVCLVRANPKYEVDGRVVG